MAYTYTPPEPKPVRTTLKDIEKEFDLWRRMGAEIGKADYPIPSSIGGAEAIVRLMLRGTPVTVQCGKFDDYATNLRLCWLTIQGMRLNEARGIDQAMAAAYAALLPAAPRDRDPYEVLGVLRGTDHEDIEAIYRSKAKRLHPDQGGDATAMRELNAAIERVRTEYSA